jgi:uncharacterized membrane protein
MLATLKRPAGLALPGLVGAAAIAWSLTGLLARPALVQLLSSAVAALVLGVLIMARAKGTASHRMLGRAWVALMSIAAVSSFWLTGLSDGLSVIHVLSVWTLIAMALAICFIRKGDVKHHKRFMIGTFLGARRSRDRRAGARAPALSLLLLGVETYSASMPAALSTAAKRGPSAFARSNT